MKEDFEVEGTLETRTHIGRGYVIEFHTKGKIRQKLVDIIKRGEIGYYHQHLPVQIQIEDE